MVKQILKTIRDTNWFIDDVFYTTRYQFDNNGSCQTIIEYTRVGEFFRKKHETIYFMAWATIGIVWLLHNIGLKIYKPNKK